MTGLMEPLTILTIRAVVLVAVITPYLPVFTMSDVAHGRDNLQASRSRLRRRPAASCLQDA
jgi:hypothetical protein